MRWQTQFKRVRRIEDTENFQDLSVRFMSLPETADLIDPLLASARREGATINDVFLAAIAEGCNKFFPALHRHAPA